MNVKRMHALYWQFWGAIDRPPTVNNGTIAVPDKLYIPPGRDFARRMQKVAAVKADLAVHQSAFVRYCTVHQLLIDAASVYLTLTYDQAGLIIEAPRYHKMTGAQQGQVDQIVAQLYANESDVLAVLRFTAQEEGRKQSHAA